MGAPLREAGEGMANVWDRIELLEGDITKLECDAIVNSANTTLLGGGGVDGAIHRAAGPKLLEECRALGGCPTGGAKITIGYKLPSRFVIHTVGPVYRDGRHGEPQSLKSCYAASLNLAVKHEIRSIAFPAISCGVYGYPMEQAARIALATTAEFLAKSESIERAIFCLFGQGAMETYRRVFDELRERR